MSERTQQFRIGLFVLVAMVLFATLVVLFSAVPALFKRGRPYTIVFTDAPGLSEGTPVRRSGVRIGEVRELNLDELTGEVKVLVAINPPYRVRQNEVPTLMTGILGSDTSIDFLPRLQVEGQPPLDRAPIPPGSELVGERAASVSSLLTRASDVLPPTQETLNDMRKSLQRLEKMAPLVEETLKEYRDLGKSARESIPDLRRTNTEIQELAKAIRESVPDARKTIKSVNDAIPDARKLMDDVASASRNVGKLSERLDVLVQTNQDKVVKAIDNFVELIQRTASLLSDENVKALNATVKNVSRASERLPDLIVQAEGTIKEATETIKDGRKIMGRADGTINRLDDVLKNLQEATKPLAERSANILKNLEEMTGKFSQTLGDISDLFKVLDQSDGTIRKLLTDPSLFNRLDEVLCQVNRSMPRIDRILKDFETFADKLARHPEALGIGGVVRPGSGLKDPPTPPGAFRR